MEIKFETKSESRNAYSSYVNNHITGVRKAFDMFGGELCRLIFNERNDIGKVSDYKELYDKIDIILSDHDKSKYSAEEFDAYAAKFYTSKEDDLDHIQNNFDKAWDHHKKYNKHHPEYWCITNTSGKITIVPMSPIYLIEMILDWISVSMTNKSNVLDWWNNSDSGRKEKSKLLWKSDFKLIDKWLNDNKDRLNFKP